MLLYKYDEQTKEYLGYFEAYLDQLETMIAGHDVYVIPPCSTPVVPEQPKDGKVLRFVDDEWEEVEDNRGLKVYDKNGEALVMTELGPIPKGYNKEKPVTLKDLKDSKIEELKVSFNEAWVTPVKVAKAEAIIDDSFKFTSLLTKFENYKKICYKDGDQTVIMNREEVEELVKRLYLKSILLAKKKENILKEVANCKSKKKLQEIEISFDVEEEVNNLLPLTDEEINKEFKKY